MGQNWSICPGIPGVSGSGSVSGSGIPGALLFAPDSKESGTKKQGVFFYVGDYGLIIFSWLPGMILIESGQQFRSNPGNKSKSPGEMFISGGHILTGKQIKPGIL